MDTPLTPPASRSVSPGSLGDRIGDLVQWSVGAFVVLGILVGLLQAVGVVWEPAPGGVLLGVLLWVLLLIGVRAVVRTSSAPRSS